jgi:hypothetical protein
MFFRARWEDNKKFLEEILGSELDPNRLFERALELVRIRGTAFIERVIPLPGSNVPDSQ